MTETKYTKKIKYKRDKDFNKVWFGFFIFYFILLHLIIFFDYDNELKFICLGLISYIFIIPLLMEITNYFVERKVYYVRKK